MSSSQLLDVERVWHNDDAIDGRLRMTTGGVGWKPKDSELAKLVTFAGSEIRSASWTRVGRGFQLKITLKKGERHVFDGLAREDLDPVKKAVEQVGGVTLDVRDVSVKGWNWGKADVQANDLAFLVQNRTTFEIPLSVISNSNMAGKNEIALEFTNPPAPRVGDRNKNLPQPKPVDELIEMRFYVPDVKRKKGRGKANGEDGEVDEDEDGDEDGEDDDGVEDGEDDITAAEAFHNAITDGANIAESATDALVTLTEVLVVTPRGRYDIFMQEDHLRLHGKTYDYKVPYKSVHRQYLLPKADGMHHQMVVGLDPPLRQGQTKYPWLVMQWESSAEDDVTVNIEEDKLENQYKGLIKKEYSDPLYKTTATLFRHLIGKEMTPPSNNFHSAADPTTKSVKCNVKANQGELYFCDKSMLFVTKQPICIDYPDITRAIFSRATAAMRSFDITIKLSTEVEHSFTSINKDEHTLIKDFLTSRKIKIKEQGEESGMRNLEDMDLGEDDDEEESSDEDADAGRKGSIGGVRPARGGDDDSEEEDEDFEGSSAPSSPANSSDASDSDADDDGDDGNVSDDMVKEAAAKALKSAKKNGGAASNGKPKVKAPAAAKKASGKPEKLSKSKDTVEESDEEEDDEDFAMDVDSGDEEVTKSAAGPAKKKQKRE